MSQVTVILKLQGKDQEYRLDAKDLILIADALNFLEPIDEEGDDDAQSYARCDELEILMRDLERGNEPDPVRWTNTEQVHISGRPCVSMTETWWDGHVEITLCDPAIAEFLPIATEAERDASIEKLRAAFPAIPHLGWREAGAQSDDFRTICTGGA